MADSISVALGERSYDILAGERLLAAAGAHIAPVLQGKNVIIISDEAVSRLYLHRLTNALEEHQIRCRPVILPAGEQTKSLEHYASLMETLLEQKPDRKTALIALGGGVIGDLTGFAASTLLRGVDFIQIPTTLLAQVDSSVGGKTGINSRFGKNLIGSFHQPVLVLADISVLSSLPERQLKAGYAEIVKYGLINDTDFFRWLEENGLALLKGDNTARQQAVLHSCRAKAAMVAADEKEKNVRALLNFGHTFAHALEAETGFSDTLLHGEAVAIGMILALQLSASLGLCPPAHLERVLKHYEATGLPASPKTVQPQWNIEALMEHFAHDKKARDGTLTFVLSRGIGRAFVAENVEAPPVKQLLQAQCA